ncbi:MAG TPA: cation diffusion facilitator family transporter [Thermomicrobiaceae bacterium]|nr:cation diffusion facilitator family transporter [Thermomicrobiaceae bacterium]
MTSRPQERRTTIIRRTLLGALLLNVGIAAAKLGYGHASHSLAITADGLNSLMDAASNVVGIVGLVIAARPPDPNHPYGHRRFETLTSLAIGISMILVLIEILQGAWQRLQHGGQPEVTLASFVVMLVTLGVNLLITTWERRNARRFNSSILAADAKHTLSDAFVALSVIAGLIAVRLGFPQADILLSLLVAGVIAFAAWSIIRHAALSLSDEAAAETPDIEAAARSTRGVEGVHNIRTRGGEGFVWVDLHIQVDPELRVERAHEIASEVAARVEHALGVPSDVTVHIEPANPAHLKPERGYHPGP